MKNVTEGEAKKKWCPFARLSDRAGPAANLQCIGSDCMAWRWEYEPPENRTSGEDQYLGFCGAFGNPYLG